MSMQRFEECVRAIENNLEDCQRENDRLQGVADILANALQDCAEYFDNRADADFENGRYHANDEMRLLNMVRHALASLSRVKAGPL